MIPAFPFAAPTQMWTQRFADERAARDLAWATTHLLWADDAVFPPGCDVRQEGPLHLERAVWFLRAAAPACWVKPSGLCLEISVDGPGAVALGVLKLRRNPRAGEPGEPPVEWYVAHFDGGDLMCDALAILAERLPRPMNWHHGVTL